MWRKYFKLVNLVPGVVIVFGFGTIDFRGEVPVETCIKLFENDWPNLAITEEGKKELYEMKGKKENPPSPPEPLLSEKRDEEESPAIEMAPSLEKVEEEEFPAVEMAPLLEKVDEETAQPVKKKRTGKKRSSATGI